MENPPKMPHGMSEQALMGACTPVMAPALRASTMDDESIIRIASRLLSAAAKAEVRFEILMAEKGEAERKASHFEALYDVLEKERGEYLNLAHEYTQNRKGHWTPGDNSVLAVINDAIRLRQEFCQDKCDVGKR